MIDEKDHAKRGLDLAYPLRLLVGGAFIIIVALTLIQVFFRSVLDSPLIWSEEVVRLLLVWVVFLGAAVVTWDGRHLNVDVAFVRLPPAIKKILRRFNLLVAVGFLAVFGWTSWKIVMLARFSEIGALPLTLAWVRVPATIGAALMIILLLARVFYSRRLNKDQDVGEGDPF